MYIKVSLIHDIQVLIYRGSTNERLSGEGVAYDSYYSETDRVIYMALILIPFPFILPPPFPSPL